MIGFSKIPPLLTVMANSQTSLAFNKAPCGCDEKHKMVSVSTAASDFPAALFPKPNTLWFLCCRCFFQIQQEIFFRKPSGEPAVKPAVVKLTSN